MKLIVGGPRLRKSKSKGRGLLVRKGSGTAIEHTGNGVKVRKVQSYFVVYYVSPKTGKNVVLQGYEDRGEANKHLQEFKKRYGKMIQAGVEETVPDKTKDLAVQKFSNRSAKLGPSIAKCQAALKQRKKW